MRIAEGKIAINTCYSPYSPVTQLINMLFDARLQINAIEMNKPFFQRRI